MSVDEASLHQHNGVEYPLVFRGADLAFMREVNRALVLNFVRTHSPTQTIAIAAGTGLSRATVSRVLDGLLGEGRVRRGALLAASAHGGRRATEIEFCANYGYIIGVDLGKSHLSLLLTDLLGNEQSVDEVDAAESSQFSDIEMGAHACLQSISNILRTFVMRHRLTWDRVFGIGLAIPAPFNMANQRLVNPPHMTGWDNIDLLELFSQLLEYPIDKIHLDNDANLGALGESRRGAGRGIDNFIYLKVGTGIGMGIVADGQLYHGSIGAAGELGHIQLGTNDASCACGLRGCLETVAGASAVLADANSGYGIAAETHIVDIAQVVGRAKGGDADCRGAIERAGEQLGIALANVANVLNPARIIVDGGLADADDLLLNPIRRTVHDHTLPLIWQSLGPDNILRGTLRTRAIATGAVLSILDRLFALPTVTSPR